MLLPSVMDTTCCGIQTLGRGSNIGYIAVSAEYLHHVAIAQMLFSFSFAITKRWNMRRNRRCIIRVMMDIHYLSLVRCIFNCIAPLVIFISSRAPTTECMIETLNFVCVVIPGKNLLAGMMLNHWPSPCCTFWVIKSIIRVCGERWTDIGYFVIQKFQFLHITPVTI